MVLCDKFVAKRQILEWRLQQGRKICCDVYNSGRSLTGALYLMNCGKFVRKQISNNHVSNS